MVRGKREAGGAPPTGWPRWILVAAAAAYGCLYLVHALTPEIQPDAIGYHLGIVGDWIRTGGFSSRVTFYEVFPLGMESLFAMAYSFGGGAAAKLVHLGLLAATAPLLISLARRLGMPAWAGASAAALYCLSPVAGIDGTCTYIDAGLTFFILACFLCLTAWAHDRNPWWLAAAGLTGGFCYAVKLTGLLAPAAAFYFIAVFSRRARDAAIFAALTLAGIAPWVLRALLLTGNPVAPLLNSIFPNPYFRGMTEANLMGIRELLQRVGPAGVPLEIAVRGEVVHGLLGPVFLLAPLALLALRKQAGRALFLAATVVSIPFFPNAGTRFLLPALPFVALALTMSLPRAAVLPLVAAHTVLSWPGVVGLYSPPSAWRLQGIPLQAALHLEPEDEYLHRTVWAYETARLVNRNLRPGEPFYDLTAAPWAYFHAVPVSPWQSDTGERITAALQFAAMPDGSPLDDFRTEWAAARYTGVRFRNRIDAAVPWSIHEVHVLLKGDPVRPRRGWSLEAEPNVWESVFVLDRNPVTRWTTWVAARAGMYLELDFAKPQAMSGVIVTSPPWHGLVIDLRREDGTWQTVAAGTWHPRPPLNVRRSAIRLLKSAGIRYVLAPFGHRSYRTLGEFLIQHKQDWGLTEVGTARDAMLLKVQ